MVGPAQSGLETTARLNNAALVRVAVFFGAALLIAMAAPPLLFAAALSSFLGLAALGVGIAALVGREPLRPEHLTRWDVAAVLYALSLMAGFFVDAPAVEEFLRNHGFEMG